MKENNEIDRRGEEDVGELELHRTEENKNKSCSLGHLSLYHHSEW